MDESSIASADVAMCQNLQAQLPQREWEEADAKAKELEEAAREARSACCFTHDSSLDSSHNSYSKPASVFMLYM